MDPGIRHIVLSRLETDGPIEKAWGALVLASLDGSAGIESELAGNAAAPRTAAAQASPAPAGAFLQSIAVEGFRGIGPARTLDLRPGPGLTLVVGRNGSGKSSFAEALEVLLTGDSLRWKERAAVWREGWRNLHHPSASLTATFLVEGERGPCQIRRRWESGAAFEAAQVSAQFHGKGRSDFGSLGWTAALRTHRPFLSYNELGSLLDEGPSKLYDALSLILGLEDLVEAQRAIQEARRSREKTLKDTAEARGRLLDRLRSVDDERARRVIAALEGKEWDLGAARRSTLRRPLTGNGSGRGRRTSWDSKPGAARTGACGCRRRRDARGSGRLAVRPRDGARPVTRSGGNPRPRSSLSRQSR